MAKKPKAPRTEGFEAVDLRLVGLIRSHDAVLRRLLCTLARRGVSFRLAAPERAAKWIDALSVHPFYKGGQFLFDLLEWDDFMLDGPAPDMLGAAQLSAILARAADKLQAFRRAIDPDFELPWADVAGVTLDDKALPALEAGFYLYQDVVLGLLESACALLAQIPASE